MRIRILGCSGGIGAGSRTTALLIDDDVLVDAGTGIGDLAIDRLKRIRHVFLTHAHLDHIAGLPMLVDTVFRQDFDTPLTVYAREETLRALQQHLFNDVIWPDFAKLPSVERPMLRYEVCDPGDTVSIGGTLTLSGTSDLELTACSRSAGIRGAMRRSGRYSIDARISKSSSSRFRSRTRKKHSRPKLATMVRAL